MDGKDRPKDVYEVDIKSPDSYVAPGEPSVDDSTKLFSCPLSSNSQDTGVAQNHSDHDVASEGSQTEHPFLFKVPPVANVKDARLGQTGKSLFKRVNRDVMDVTQIAPSSFSKRHEEQTEALLKECSAADVAHISDAADVLKRILSETTLTILTRIELLDRSFSLFVNKQPDDSGLRTFVERYKSYDPTKHCLPLTTKSDRETFDANSLKDETGAMKWRKYVKVRVTPTPEEAHMTGRTKTSTLPTLRNTNNIASLLSLHPCFRRSLRFNIERGGVEWDVIPDWMYREYPAVAKAIQLDPTYDGKMHKAIIVNKILTIDMRHDNTSQDAPALNTQPSEANVEAAIEVAAALRPYAPRSEALLDIARMSGLNEVDDPINTNLISGWLTKVWGMEESARPDGYGTCVFEEASAIIPIAAIGRQIYPGIKFDLMPIFVGKQGSGKSTLCRIIANNDDEFATISSEALTDNQKRIEASLGKTVLEFAELDGMHKYEAESLKSAISSTSDTYRPPYGRANATVTVKRRNILIGTTNNEHFLNDPTGDRRYVVLNTVDADCDLKLARYLYPEVVKEALRAWLKVDRIIYSIAGGNMKERSNLLEAANICMGEEGQRASAMVASGHTQEDLPKEAVPLLLTPETSMLEAMKTSPQFVYAEDLGNGRHRILAIDANLIKSQLKQHARILKIRKSYDRVADLALATYLRDKNCSYREVRKRYNTKDGSERRIRLVTHATAEPGTEQYERVRDAWESWLHACNKLGAPVSMKDVESDIILNGSKHNDKEVRH